MEEDERERGRTEMLSLSCSSSPSRKKPKVVFLKNKKACSLHFYNFCHRMNKDSRRIWRTQFPRSNLPFSAAAASPEISHARRGGGGRERMGLRLGRVGRERGKERELT